VLIPKTIGLSGRSYGQRYDSMQMRYFCQLLTIYSSAFISEGGFCRCVVISYEGSILQYLRMFSIFCKTIPFWFIYMALTRSSQIGQLTNANYCSSHVIQWLITIIHVYIIASLG